jgi:hypothetical protein
MLDFRPFAAKFVDTTYEDYSKKHERSGTAPLSAPAETVKKRVDLRRLYPHKHSDEELEERMEKFLTLREKVTRQKQRIRRATVRHQQLKVMKAKEEMDRAMEIKLARMHFEKQIRLMADTLPAKRQTSSQYSTRPRTVNRPPVETDHFFDLTAPKAESTQATARLMQPKETPYRYADELGNKVICTKSQRDDLVDSPAMSHLHALNHAKRSQEQPKHARTKSLQPASDLEGEVKEYPRKSKLESLQRGLISKSKVSSPAYRSMMAHELSQIKHETEFSYEAIVGAKSKRKQKIPLYKPKEHLK